LRQRHRALGGFHRLDVRRGAIANTTRDTLGNAREPEQVIGKIPVQVRDGAAGDVAVDLRGRVGVWRSEL
jgi:hypothetical protein